MFILERVIAGVAPHACLNCGSEGGLLCEWCFSDCFPPVPPRCYKCYAATSDSAVCAKCCHKTPLKRVWVRTDYDGLARQLVHAFKFERMQATGTIIAEYLQTTIPYMQNAMIVPIPTASSRLRQRGYDHAKLIAKELSRKTGLPRSALLARHGQTRQVGTKRAERLQQTQGAFRLSKPKLIKDAHILLVDDVVTTGATLEEAARTLKRAGAKTVDAVVFAQKQ
jgi:ComF family protein